MKTVLITGATAGFGAAMARQFAEAGWRVIGTGRRAERLQSLEDEFGADRFHPAVFDIRDASAMDAALSSLPESFRAIDVLVNNAGLARECACAACEIGRLANHDRDERYATGKTHS